MKQQKFFQLHSFKLCTYTKPIFSCLAPAALHNMSLKAKVKHELDRVNALKHIKDVLTSIVLGSMRNNYSYAKTILPVIKELLIDTVDDIWKLGKKTFKELADSEEFEEKDTYLSHNIRYPSQGRYNSSLHEPDKFSEKKIKIKSPLTLEGITGKNKKFSDITSEFSYGNGPTFSRSIRELDKKPTITPGPACYDFTRYEIKLKPPKAIFPTVSKRDSYIPVTSSPGPGKYYGSFRYLSRP